MAYNGLIVSQRFHYNWQKPEVYCTSPNSRLNEIVNTFQKDNILYFFGGGGGGVGGHPSWDYCLAVNIHVLCVIRSWIHSCEFVHHESLGCMMNGVMIFAWGNKKNYRDILHYNHCCTLERVSFHFSFTTPCELPSPA